MFKHNWSQCARTDVAQSLVSLSAQQRAQVKVQSPVTMPGFNTPVGLAIGQNDTYKKNDSLGRVVSHLQAVDSDNSGRRISSVSRTLLLDVMSSTSARQSALN